MTADQPAIANKLRDLHDVVDYLSPVRGMTRRVKMADRVCKKCESNDIVVRWHADERACREARLISDRGYVVRDTEHLHAICRCCQYRWIEETADSIPKKADGQLSGDFNAILSCGCTKSFQTFNTGEFTCCTVHSRIVGYDPDSGDPIFNRDQMIFRVEDVKGGSSG